MSLAAFISITGLKLNLFIESLQYVRELSHSAGARVAIHDQNSVSFPDEEGINVLPGISTSVGVRRVRAALLLLTHRPRKPFDSPLSVVIDPPKWRPKIEIS